MSGYLMSEEMYQRVSEVVRWFERERGRSDLRAGGPPPAVEPVLVRVTGAISSGLYPGVPTFWNQAANAWQDFDACKFKASNGETLVNGSRYGARAAGFTAAGVPLYVTLNPGPAGALEVKEADGSPDYTGVTVLIANQATTLTSPGKLSLSQPSGAGTATLSVGVLSADLTQWGIVTTTSQSFTGAKTFFDNLISQSQIRLDGTNTPIGATPHGSAVATITFYDIAGGATSNFLVLSAPDSRGGAGGSVSIGLEPALNAVQVYNANVPSTVQLLLNGNPVDEHVAAPTLSSDAGNSNYIAWNTSFLYVYTGVSWKRIALVAF